MRDAVGYKDEAAMFDYICSKVLLVIFPRSSGLATIASRFHETWKYLVVAASR
jgi:hypothetical protein